MTLSQCCEVLHCPSRLDCPLCWLGDWAHLACKRVLPLHVQFFVVEWSHASQSEARDRPTMTEETRLGPNQPELIPTHL